MLSCRVHHNCRADLLLRSLALRLQTTADELHAFWQASPSPPTTERRESSDPTTSLPSTVYRMPEEMGSTATDQESLSPPWPTEQRPSSDFVGINQYQEDRSRSSASTEPMPGAAVDPTKSLTSRGKGNYVCPHGTGCSKGGVKPDGDLVIFERNSAFRSVTPFGLKNLLVVDRQPRLQATAG